MNFPLSDAQNIGSNITRYTHVLVIFREACLGLPLSQPLDVLVHRVDQQVLLALHLLDLLDVVLGSLECCCCSRGRSASFLPRLLRLVGGPAGDLDLGLHLLVVFLNLPNCDVQLVQLVLSSDMESRGGDCGWVRMGASSCDLASLRVASSTSTFLPSQSDVTYFSFSSSFHARAFPRFPFFPHWGAGSRRLLQALPLNHSIPFLGRRGSLLLSLSFLLLLL